MADDANRGDALDAARRLHELALDYAARSHAAATELIRSFEIAASALTGEIGELVVTDEDDERLVVTARGRLSGRVLLDDSNPRWQSLDSPDDVAEHYDAVDLFADIADTVVEAFPEIDDTGGPEEAPDDEADGSADDDVGVASGNDPAAQESATLRVLQNLHAAGILTDAEFESKRSELRQ